MDNYNLFQTPKETQVNLAKKFKSLRKKLGISQRELAERSGVSYASIKRFEQEGLISLESLLKIAHVCNRLVDFDSIFKLEDTERLEKLFKQK